MAIADQLTLLASTKTAIKQAIEDKGVTVGTVPFADYPTKIAAISGAASAPTPAPWVRPSDWLPLPTVTETDQKFVGLHAIYPDANFVALSAAGDYTVDWGDGVVENFASDTIAQHEYNYATYDTGNATLCSRGYKQAVVTVTPQAGQSLTTLNLHQRHSALAVQYSSGFLDIALASASLTDLRIGAQIPGSTTQTVYMADLEQINIVRSDLRTLENLFYTCYSLQSIAGLATSTKAASTLSVAFTDTGDLVSAPGHGLRNGDTVILASVVGTTGLLVGSRYFVVAATTDTFQLSGAYGGAAIALTTDGSGVLACGTSMSSMFVNCNSLTSVPLFNTAAVTSMSSMFVNCFSLTSVPLFNTAAVTNMTSMFGGCNSLTSVPLFNTAAVTSMSFMLYNCPSLASVPLFDTTAVTNMSFMLYNCPSLASVPLFDTAAVTNMANMLNNCPSLAKVSMTGMKVSFSVANCKLSAARLNEIYSNLATVTGQTITVTGNYGTATDNPTIATAKGWTVTG